MFQETLVTVTQAARVCPIKKSKEPIFCDKSTQCLVPIPLCAEVGEARRVVAAIADVTAIVRPSVHSDAQIVIYGTAILKTKVPFKLRRWMDGWDGKAEGRSMQSLSNFQPCAGPSLSSLCALEPGFGSGIYSNLI